MENAMSERGNEQTIRHAYAAFQRGDIPMVLSKLTDDVQWTLPGKPDVPYAGTYHGQQGVAEFFQRLSKTEDVQTFEPRTFLSAGDLVVVLGHYAARVKATGQTAQTDWVHVFTFRDGKVASWQEYYDTASYARAYRATAGIA
jgi:ketosteroid isomerase-like protein